MGSMGLVDFPTFYYKFMPNVKVIFPSPMDPMGYISTG